MKQVLVLAGRYDEWRDWAAMKVREIPEAKVWMPRMTLEADGVQYQGALSTHRTEGHSCSEVIKIGTYWKVFSPDELRMIDFCAEVEHQRLETATPSAA